MLKPYMKVLISSVLPEHFKTRAAHFTIQRDGRTGMQRATLGKSGSEAAATVTRSDSESIFQQQVCEYHGYDGCD